MARAFHVLTGPYPVLESQVGFFDSLVRRVWKNCSKDNTGRKISCDVGIRTAISFFGVVVAGVRCVNR